MSELQFDTNIHDTPLKHAQISGHAMGRDAVYAEEARVANLVHAGRLREVMEGIDTTTISGQHNHDYVGQTAQRADELATESVLTDGIKESLRGVKESLGALPEDSKHGLNSIFREQVPPFIRQRYQSWVSEQIGNRPLGQKLSHLVSPNKRMAYMADMMATTSMVDWLHHGATDPELLNFLQWHTTRVEALQSDPEIKALIEAERAEYKQAAAKAIDDGYLHATAIDFIDQIDDEPVIISDYFEGATRHSGAGGFARRSLDSKYTYGVVQDLPRAAHIIETEDKNQTVDAVEHAAFHEWNHLMGELGPFWSNEAFTEHIHQALKHGDWQVISPIDRQDNGAYPEFRRLLATVIEPLTGMLYNQHAPKSLEQRASLDKDAIASFTKLYSAQSGSGRMYEQLLVDHMLEASYGSKHIFDAIQHRIEQHLAELSELEEFKDDPNDFSMLGLAAAKTEEEWRNNETRDQIISHYEYLLTIDPQELNEQWL